MHGPCCVDGCDRTAHYKTLRFCQPHYKRFKKYGDAGPATIRIMRPGTPCSIEGCENPYVALGWCRAHYLRYRQYGRPDEPSHYGAVRGERHPFWAGSEVEYKAAHLRVKRARGVAKRYKCECGAQAQHWAYDHEDPAELTDPRGLRYSGDPSRYQPMCAPCHSEFDRMERLRVI